MGRYCMEIVKDLAWSVQLNNLIIVGRYGCVPLLLVCGYFGRVNEECAYLAEMGEEWKTMRCVRLPPLTLPLRRLV
jgi:hypothetical protein